MFVVILFVFSLWYRMHQSFGGKTRDRFCFLRTKEPLPDPVDSWEEYQGCSFFVVPHCLILDQWKPSLTIAKRSRNMMNLILIIGVFSIASSCGFLPGTVLLPLRGTQRCVGILFCCHSDRVALLVFPSWGTEIVNIP